MSWNVTFQCKTNPEIEDKYLSVLSTVSCGPNSRGPNRADAAAVLTEAKLTLHTADNRSAREITRLTMIMFRCQLLHRTAGDTERRYHLRYYKTGMCVHDTDNRSASQERVEA